MSKANATLKEVAAYAGVSYQTVSKVINQKVQVSKETEARIWEAVSALGYRPNYTARSLRTQRSFTIGYSWPPSPANQANPILDQFLQTMFITAEAQGYYLLCFPYHEDYKKHLATYEDLMNTGRVDGFILSSVEYDDPRVMLLLERKFPFVSFGRSNPELSFSWIDVDGGEGIRQAVEHILQQGHRRIAALCWPELSRVGNNRAAGYFSVMQAAGITPLDSWVKRGEGCFDFGYSAALELLDLPEDQRPTALITMNDLMAVGAMQAVQSRGLRVGPDFAIAGFDDAPMVQYLAPGLTTVRQPIVEVGQRIIPLLLNQLNAEEVPEPTTIMIAPQLVVRGSTQR
jgi:DNA-binding LacI/PurR family transcriptional regulator